MTLPPPRHPAASRGLIPLPMVAAVLPTSLVILGDSLIYIVLPASLVEFGIEDAAGLSAAFWLGLALSINRFIRFGGNLFAAWVYQSIGFRGPFVLAAALGVVTTLSYGFTRSIALLILARALWGISYSFLRLGAYLVAFDTGGRSAGRLLGFYNAAQRGGSLFAVTVGALLADVATRQVTFTILAAIGIIGVLVATRAPRLRFRRPAPGGAAEDRTPTWRRVMSGARRSLVPAVAPGLERLQRRLVVLSFVMFGTAFAGNGLVIATVSPYLLQLYGDGGANLFGVQVGILTLAGLLVGVKWFNDLVLGMPLGHLSDVIGRRKTVLGGVAVMLAALLTLGVLATPPAVVSSIIVLFIGAGIAAVALHAEAGETSPDGIRPAAMARFGTWLDLGAAFGPLAGFLIAERFGFQAAYLAAAALLAVGAYAYLAVSSGRPGSMPAGRSLTSSG